MDKDLSEIDLSNAWNFETSGWIETCAPWAENRICFKANARNLYDIYREWCYEKRLTALNGKYFSKFMGKLFEHKAYDGGEFWGIRIARPERPKKRTKPSSRPR